MHIGFYGPLRKALRIGLNSIIEKKASKGNIIDVIVRTYSPSHFTGDWDKGGTCSKTRPYKDLKEWMLRSEGLRWKKWNLLRQKPNNLEVLGLR